MCVHCSAFDCTPLDRRFNRWINIIFQLVQTVSTAHGELWLFVVGRRKWKLYISIRLRFDWLNNVTSRLSFVDWENWKWARHRQTTEIRDRKMELETDCPRGTDISYSDGQWNWFVFLFSLFWASIQTGKAIQNGNRLVFHRKKRQHSDILYNLIESESESISN